MRCLVTGGTGLVGSNIARALLQEGHDVLITGNHYEQAMPEFEGKILFPHFIGLDWDRLGKIDVLFHEAAITDNQFHDEQEIERANILSTKKLWEEVIARGCKHIVYASSTAIYGFTQPPYNESMEPAPHNAYARSKVWMENFAKEMSAKHPEVVFVGLRYCNVFGRGETHKGRLATMIYNFAQQMVNGNPRLFKHGEQKRDYIYVKDVVRANLLAMKATESFVVNCAGGSSTSFNDIVAMLNKVMGLERTPEYFDNPYGENYQSYTECDMRLAKEKLGFEPKWSVEKGIQDYYDEGFLVKK